eukprot:MONOS_896.1-p1 / transcript=MONOS_896.1 / gene=MONOS_896 / organism=Monocercomonoides_exilis_PA203 / gene_product=unspecified product / transcript_product=unspecified product / location=Mono_scaffold00015:14338-24012(+) / protein_length=3096 / sequence_SO=supercontig / SO=protein_coding / is_pseudo=false
MSLCKFSNEHLFYFDYLFHIPEIAISALLQFSLATIYGHLVWRRSVFDSIMRAAVRSWAELTKRDDKSGGFRKLVGLPEKKGKKGKKGKSKAFNINSFRGVIARTGEFLASVFGEGIEEESIKWEREECRRRRGEFIAIPKRKKKAGSSAAVIMEDGFATDKDRKEYQLEISESIAFDEVDDYKKGFYKESEVTDFSPSSSSSTDISESVEVSSSSSSDITSLDANTKMLNRAGLEWLSHFCNIIASSCDPQTPMLSSSSIALSFIACFICKLLSRIADEQAVWTVRKRRKTKSDATEGDKKDSQDLSTNKSEIVFVKKNVIPPRRCLGKQCLSSLLKPIFPLLFKLSFSKSLDLSVQAASVFGYAAELDPLATLRFLLDSGIMDFPAAATEKQTADALAVIRAVVPPIFGQLKKIEKEEEEERKRNSKEGKDENEEYDSRKSKRRYVDEDCSYVRNSVEFLYQSWSKAVELIDANNETNTNISLDIIVFFLSKIPLIDAESAEEQLMESKKSSIAKLSPDRLPTVTPLIADELKRLTSLFPSMISELLSALLMYVTSYNADTTSSASSASSDQDFFNTSVSSQYVVKRLITVLFLFFQQLPPSKHAMLMEQVTDVIESNAQTIALPLLASLLSALSLSIGARRVLDEWLLKKWRRNGWWPLMKDEAEKDRKEMKEKSRLLRERNAETSTSKEKNEQNEKSSQRWMIRPVEDLRESVIEDVRKEGVNLFRRQVYMMAVIIKQSGRCCMDMFPSLVTLSLAFTHPSLPKKSVHIGSLLLQNIIITLIRAYPMEIMSHPSTLFNNPSFGAFHYLLWNVRYSAMPRVKQELLSMERLANWDEEKERKIDWEEDEEVVEEEDKANRDKKCGDKQQMDEEESDISPLLVKKYKFPKNFSPSTLWHLPQEDEIQLGCQIINHVINFCIETLNGITAETSLLILNTSASQKAEAIQTEHSASSSASPSSSQAQSQIPSTSTVARTLKPAFRSQFSYTLCFLRSTILAGIPLFKRFTCNRLPESMKSDAEENGVIETEEEKKQREEREEITRKMKEEKRRERIEKIRSSRISDKSQSPLLGLDDKQIGENSPIGLGDDNDEMEKAIEESGISSMIEDMLQSSQMSANGGNVSGSGKGGGGVNAQGNAGERGSDNGDGAELLNLNGIDEEYCDDSLDGIYVDKEEEDAIMKESDALVKEDGFVEKIEMNIVTLKGKEGENIEKGIICDSDLPIIKTQQVIDEMLNKSDSTKQLHALSPSLISTSAISSSYDSASMTSSSSLHSPSLLLSKSSPSPSPSPSLAYQNALYAPATASVIEGHPLNSQTVNYSLPPFEYLFEAIHRVTRWMLQNAPDSSDELMELFLFYQMMLLQPRMSTFSRFSNIWADCIEDASKGDGLFIKGYIAPFSKVFNSRAKAVQEEEVISYFKWDKLLRKRNVARCLISKYAAADMVDIFINSLFSIGTRSCFNILPSALQKAMAHRCMWIFQKGVQDEKRLLRLLAVMSTRGVHHEISEDPYKVMIFLECVGCVFGFKEERVRKFALSFFASKSILPTILKNMSESKLPDLNTFLPPSLSYPRDTLGLVPIELFETPFVLPSPTSQIDKKCMQSLYNPKVSFVAVNSDQPSDSDCEASPSSQTTLQRAKPPSLSQNAIKPYYKVEQLKISGDLSRYLVSPYPSDSARRAVCSQVVSIAKSLLDLIQLSRFAASELEKPNCRHQMEPILMRVLVRASSKSLPLPKDSVPVLLSLLVSKNPTVQNEALNMLASECGYFFPTKSNVLLSTEGWKNFNSSLLDYLPIPRSQEEAENCIRFTDFVQQATWSDNVSLTSLTKYSIKLNEWEKKVQSMTDEQRQEFVQNEKDAFRDIDRIYRFLLSQLEENEDLLVDAVSNMTSPWSPNSCKNVAKSSSSSPKCPQEPPLNPNSALPSEEEMQHMMKKCVRFIARKLAGTIWIFNLKKLATSKLMLCKSAVHQIKESMHLKDSKERTDLFSDEEAEAARYLLRNDEEGYRECDYLWSDIDILNQEHPLFTEVIHNASINIDTFATSLNNSETSTELEFLSDYESHVHAKKDFVEALSHSFLNPQYLDSVLTVLYERNRVTRSYMRDFLTKCLGLLGMPFFNVLAESIKKIVTPEKMSESESVQLVSAFLGIVIGAGKLLRWEDYVEMTKITGEILKKAISMAGGNFHIILQEISSIRNFYDFRYLIWLYDLFAIPLMQQHELTVEEKAEVYQKVAIEREKLKNQKGNIMNQKEEVAQKSNMTSQASLTESHSETSASASLQKQSAASSSSSYSTNLPLRIIQKYACCLSALFGVFSSEGIIRGLRSITQPFSDSLMESTAGAAATIASNSIIQSFVLEREHGWYSTATKADEVPHSIAKRLMTEENTMCKNEKCENERCNGVANDESADDRQVSELLSAKSVPFFMTEVMEMRKEQKKLQDSFIEFTVSAIKRGSAEASSNERTTISEGLECYSKYFSLGSFVPSESVMNLYRTIPRLSDGCRYRSFSDQIESSSSSSSSQSNKEDISNDSSSGINWIKCLPVKEIKQLSDKIGHGLPSFPPSPAFSVDCNDHLLWLSRTFQLLKKGYDEAVEEELVQKAKKNESANETQSQNASSSDMNVDNTNKASDETHEQLASQPSADISQMKEKISESSPSSTSSSSSSSSLSQSQSSSELPSKEKDLKAFLQKLPPSVLSSLPNRNLLAAALLQRSQAPSPSSLPSLATSSLYATNDADALFQAEISTVLTETRRDSRIQQFKSFLFTAISFFSQRLSTRNVISFSRTVFESRIVDCFISLLLFEEHDLSDLGRKFCILMSKSRFQYDLRRVLVSEWLKAFGRVAEEEEKRKRKTDPSNLNDEKDKSSSQPHQETHINSSQFLPSPCPPSFICCELPIDPRNLPWRLADVCVDVMYNTLVMNMQSTKETLGSAVAVLVAFLQHSRVEVRDEAMNVLMLLFMSVLSQPMEQALVNEFGWLSAAGSKIEEDAKGMKQSTSSSSSSSSNSESSQVQKASTHEAQACELHGGVSGLSASVISHPFDLAPWLGRVLVWIVSLSKAGEGSPVGRRAKETLRAFWMTHRDAWVDHKKEITDEQVDIIRSNVYGHNYFS